MTEKTKGEKMSSSSNMGGSGGKPVPMRLFAAWEVDRTPPNCIPRLCSLTITRLSLLTPLPNDLTSVSLAVKMQSSKRILRSHEIPVPHNVINSSGNLQQQQNISLSSSSPSSQQQQGINQSIILTSGNTYSGANVVSTQGNNLFGVVGGVSTVTSSSAITTTTTTSTIGTLVPFLETDLDLHFSLQYPHFIKRDGSTLVILLQRRKKYKSRTILGYKTLAEGMIRMDAVLQKSMDMIIELVATGKSGRPGVTVATLRAERVSSIPVDQDNKNNNSVLLTDRVNEYSDDDEEAEFSSGEDNDDNIDVGLSGYDSKREMRKYRKLDRNTENDGEAEDVQLGQNAGDSDSEFEMKNDKGSSRAKLSRKISLQQRNFKQKIVALLKRFKVNEELDGGVVTRGAVSLHGERDLDALFQELESLSCGEADDSGPDLDSISVGSTPKPSLRPFFTNSRNVLHDNITGNIINNNNSTDGRRPSNKSDTAIDNKKNITATTPDRGPEGRNDSSGNEGNAGNTDPEAQNSDPQNTGTPPKEKDTTSILIGQTQQQQIATTPASSTEKRSRLFRTSSSTPGSSKKKQSLSLSAEPKSVLETCLSPTNVEPRKLLLDQLSKVFSTEDTILPDIVTIITPPEALGGNQIATRLSTIFTATFRPAFIPQNTAEVKAVLQALVIKIQKYCNSTAKPPSTVKILLLGNDWLQGAVLRHYVELLGVRPPDWVHHMRFFIVPIGSSSISRYLCSIDQSYYAMFGTDNWQQLCERSANSDSVLVKTDIVELTNRIQRYLHAAGPCTQLPIAEAMVNYKEEDSCQIFVPFISDVRIGFPEGPQLSLEFDETSNQQQINSSVATGGLSSSPPLSGRSSPPMPITTSQQQQQQLQLQQQQLQQQQQQQQNQESIELQIDYWTIVKHNETKDKNASKSGDQSKNSIKSTFRHLQVWRLPQQNAQIGDVLPGLTVCFATKEKKQKIMRLGKKKEKDRDQEKEQIVEGVARLICSPKHSHPIPLRVYIDGTEWTGVKFFQLSSQWQTHVKNFPIALVSTPMSELS